jgi:hypothetical protein
MISTCCWLSYVNCFDFLRDKIEVKKRGPSNKIAKDIGSKRGTTNSRSDGVGKSKSVKGDNGTNGKNEKESKGILATLPWYKKSDNKGK